MKPHLALLKKLDACAEVRAFAETCADLETVWNACDRSDWMIWLLRRLKYDDAKVYRLYACWCVRNTPLADGRKVWDLLTDPRSRAAVEVAERYAVGEATLAELNEARSAAYATADAAADAAYAAAPVVDRSLVEINVIQQVAIGFERAPSAPDRYALERGLHLNAVVDGRLLAATALAASAAHAAPPTVK